MGTFMCHQWGGISIYRPLSYADGKQLTVPNKNNNHWSFV